MVKLQRVFHTRTHTPLTSALAGRCFNSFWVWKSGVNYKLATFFFGQDRLSSSENTQNSVLPAQRQWEYHREKMSSDSSNVHWWKLMQDTGGLNIENCGFMWGSHIPPRALTWSYSDAPGYRGQPRNSSAMTQPRDHMSMASQNGKPRMISGALVRKKGKEKAKVKAFYSGSCISFL